MKALFHIHHANGATEGPVDLLTLMRRIKSGKINAQTLISMEPQNTPLPANQVEDLRLFFDGESKPAEVEQVKRPSGIKLLKQMIRSGWRFVSTNQGMCVFAGTIVLMTFLLSFPLYDLAGPGVAIMIGSMIYFFLQSVFLICALRINRGQHINMEFIQQAVLNNFTFLFMSSCVLAVMFWTGLAFLLIPGIVFLTAYIFVPFLIADRGYSVFEAMKASRILAGRNRSAYFSAMLMLMGLHVIACASVLLIPLTLPMLAAPIAELYDELSYKS